MTNREFAWHWKEYAFDVGPRFLLLNFFACPHCFFKNWRSWPLMLAQCFSSDRIPLKERYDGCVFLESEDCVRFSPLLPENVKRNMSLEELGPKAKCDDEDYFYIWDLDRWIKMGKLVKL